MIPQILESLDLTSQTHIFTMVGMSNNAALNTLTRINPNITTIEDALRVEPGSENMSDRHPSQSSVADGQPDPQTQRSRQGSPVSERPTSPMMAFSRYQRGILLTFS